MKYTRKREEAAGQYGPHSRKKLDYTPWFQFKKPTLQPQDDLIGNRVKSKLEIGIYLQKRHKQ